MEKDLEYIVYINEHTANIKKAWEIVKPKLTGEKWLDDATFLEISQRVLYHDITKFTSNEFHGYRKKFYPDKTESQNEEAIEGFFQKSWLHHIHSNDHHWNHWIVSGDGIILSMPFVCIFEMLLDWFAMALKFGDTVEDFYNKNKESMLMHDETRKCVELWMGLFTDED